MRYTRRQERINNRNDKIKADYATLFGKGYRTPYIYAHLSDKYDLAESTLYYIVNNIGRYAESNTENNG